MKITRAVLEHKGAEYVPPPGITFTEKPPDYAAYSDEQMVRVALAAADITAALNAGMVRFKYWAVIKQRMRLAFGTRNTALFSYAFKGGSVGHRTGLVAYWDFMVMPGKGGSQWRSFYVANVQMEPRGVLNFPNAPQALLPPEADRADTGRQSAVKRGKGAIGRPGVYPGAPPMLLPPEEDRAASGG